MKSNIEVFQKAALAVDKNKSLAAVMKRCFGVPTRRVPERGYIEFIMNVEVPDERKEEILFYVLSAYARYGTGNISFAQAVSRSHMSASAMERVNTLLMARTPKLAMMQLTKIIPLIGPFRMSTLYDDLCCWNRQTRRKWAQEIVKENDDD